MRVENMGAGTMKTGRTRTGSMRAVRNSVIAFAMAFALGAPSIGALGVGVAFAAAPESASATDVSGSASLASAGNSAALTGDSQIREGDVVSLGAGAKATIRFADGGSLALVGPARLSFVKLAENGRRVRLESGTIAAADIRGVATEIQTSTGASLVLQSASASASVAGSSATFTKTGGSFAKVWRDGSGSDLSGTWSSAAGVAAAGERRAVPASVAVEVVEAATVIESSERASVASVVGRATLASGEDVSRVNAATVFSAGDLVTVASGGQVSIRFEDGATALLGGPAELLFVELNPDARRIKLRSGVITEVYGRGVATEIQTPYDASLVLQNATGYARVRPGDRVAFQKIDGDLAQVYHAERYQDLTGGWTLNVRSGDLSTGAVASMGGMNRGTSMRRFTLNQREIAFGPPEDFKVETRSSGGVRLTYNGDDYGVVKVGPHSTVFFLANGQSIEFDQNGDVISYDGISHIYHPLTDVIFYDEPVENAADASISGPGRR